MSFEYEQQYAYRLSQRKGFLLDRQLQMYGGEVNHPLFSPRSTGVIVEPGYAWDGPSGPTIDTTNAIRASLLHDVLYQAMREKLIPRKRNRRIADAAFRKILKEDGMHSFRRWLWWITVRLFGGYAVKPQTRDRR